MIVGEIEKDVPFVETKRRSPSVGVGRKSKFPFEKMSVGDSFAVSEAKGANVRGAMTRAHKKFDARFKCAAENDNTFRVWRVA